MSHISFLQHERKIIACSPLPFMMNDESMQQEAEI